MVAARARLVGRGAASDSRPRDTGGEPRDIGKQARDSGSSGRDGDIRGRGKGRVRRDSGNRAPDAGRIAGATQKRVAAWRAIAAGIVLTAVAGGWAAQKAIERREGETARREVLIALHIASSKVRTAQQHVHEIGSH